eukprot:1593759-Prymnesium_polylepis.2
MATWRPRALAGRPPVPSARNCLDLGRQGCVYDRTHQVCCQRRIGSVSVARTAGFARARAADHKG